MTKKERDQHNKRYWNKLLTSWQTSGLSPRQFCKSQGIKPGRFYYWKNKLLNPTTPDSSVTFCPVRVVAEAPTNSYHSDNSGIRIILNEGRYHLELNNNFSAPTLSKLLTVLEAT